jgi:CheY-like chemotaxis protein
MASKSLLLISANPEDQAFAIQVAMSAGLSLQTVADPVEGAAIIAAEQPSVILCDTSSEQHYQALETAIQESIGLFSDKINANSIYFLSSESLEKVQYLVQSPLFGHFILRNYGDPKEAGEHFGRIVKATSNERAFGLKQLLKDGAKVQTIKLQITTQKQDAVEAIKNYLLAAKFQSRMATVIANAVDELLMNAMFDAPTDELGRALFNSTARTASIKLEGRHNVEMHVGYDGRYVAITAIDHFGSLDKAKLLTHISKLYTEEEYKVRTSIAGAGIGLATVFRSGGSFFFVSESRARTEVTVFFKRTDNFREFKDQFKFLSTQFYF